MACSSNSDLFDDQHFDGDIGQDFDETVLVENANDLIIVGQQDSKDGITKIQGLPKKENELVYGFYENLGKVRKAIESNRKLKDNLKAFEDKLQIKMRQLTLSEEKLPERNVSTSEGTKNYNYNFYKSFLYPYFRDKDSSCPLNYDEVEKRKLKPGLYENFGFCTDWNFYEIRSLEEVIRDTIAQEYLRDKDENSLKDISLYQKQLNMIYTKSIENIFKHLDVGPFDWEEMSTLMPHPHSPRDCQALWNMYLQPSIKKQGWTKIENIALLTIAKELKYQNWEEIAKQLNTGRSGYQCFIQYKKHKFEFTWKEDDLSKLSTIIKASTVRDGSINWAKVMFYFDSASIQQVYTKWYKSMLKTGKEAQRGKFNFYENKCMIKAIKMDGFSPQDVPKVLPNRNSAQICRRYSTSLAFSDKKYGAWTEEEDVQLMELVNIYGEGNWAKIALHMKDRTRTQIRQHYKHVKFAISKNPKTSILTYRKRHAVISRKRRNQPLVRNEDYLKKLKSKYDDDYELLKYFSYQRKMIDVRHMIGSTLEERQNEIFKVCKMLGVQFPEGNQPKASNDIFWNEYKYEAVKFITTRKIRNELPSFEEVGSSLTLFPPNLINANTLNRVILKLENDKDTYGLIDENCDLRGPLYEKTLSNFMKRLFIVFAMPSLLKTLKIKEFEKIKKRIIE